MTSSDTPQPPLDPESEGIPDYADDTSTAYDESDRPRFNDSPSALPAEEPQAVDEYGVTAAEARQGEPLDDQLSREEPDTPVDSPRRPPEPELAEEAVGEAAAAQAAHDSDVLGTEPAPDAGAGSVASVQDLARSGGRAGRLVEPDEGARVDAEADLVAEDDRDAGGGLTAEEQAMHEVVGNEIRYEP